MNRDEASPSAISPVAEGSASATGNRIGQCLRQHSYRWLRLILVLAVSALAGWLAHLLHVPLAWLLGSLMASTVMALKGWTINLDGVRPYVLIFLGLGLGQTFNEAVMRMLLESLPAIVICSFMTLLVGIPGAKVFTRYAGMDGKTAFFCGVPGGVVLMAIHAREAGLSEQQVVLAQTVRLIVVVLLYPALVAALPADNPVLQGALPGTGHHWSLTGLLLWWLAGIGAAVLGKKIGIPNPWMLAPCVLSAGFASAGLVPEPIPDALIVVAQIVLGVTLGARMTPEFMRGARRLIVASLLSSLLLSVVLIALALLASRLFHLSLPASLLGMSPGGMPEMAVTAHALQVSVPLVLGFHFIRVVFCNLLLELFWRAIRALRLV